MPSLEITGDLSSWDDIKPRFLGHSILIGNGVSCAIWRKFHYSSLYEKAVSDERLSAVDIHIFGRLGTTNFENVLSGLATTSAVLEAMGSDTSEIVSRYESIKDALAVSLKEIHIPWARAQAVFSSIYSALSEYRVVYSTNYDLIIYWSILQGGESSSFKDYFWPSGNVFDLKDTSVGEGSIKVFYLHGGLHLESLPNGFTHKRVNDGRTLLEQFGESSMRGAVPLVVTEGTSEQKMQSIQNSTYLSFAYEQFAIDNCPLLIMGHSLDDSDSHLVAALKKHPRPLAVSIYALSDSNTIEKKARFLTRLSGLDVDFFDAGSHPLGHRALHINENG